MKRLALTVGLAAALLAACGGSEPSGEEAAPRAEPAASSARPTTLPPSVLPELNESARPLDLPTLAADSFDPPALEQVLAESGYVAGAEREFFGRGRTFEHVVARALTFESADGAAAYVDWVAGHAEDFLGRAEREAKLGLGDSEALFSLVRCDVCKKQQPAFLAAWHRGGTAAFLLGAGPGVNRETFEGLARKLDARIAP